MGKEIVKNLLLNNTCENCFFGELAFLDIIKCNDGEYLSPSKMCKRDEYKTCKNFKKK